jgi:hypothetical protein
MIRRCLLAAAAAVMLAGAAAPDPDTLPDPSPIPKAPAGVAHTAQQEYRTDTLELTLARAGDEGSELDYFVVMKAGDSLVYDWSAKGAPDTEFYSDFHGMTPGTPPSQVLTYREGMAASAKGSLTAPFEGTHGWLFKNDSAKPVTVKLTIAGFYELRSLRDAMGLTGGDYVPFGPPGWADRYGPTQK